MATYNGEEIPDQDYADIATDWVIKLLNYLGYEWPTTNTGVLDAWADQWRQVQHQIDAFAADLAAAESHVLQNNSGQVAEAFAAFTDSDDGCAKALRALAGGANTLGGAYSAVSLLVTGLRAAVIGEILLDAVQIGMAVFTGGLSAAGSVLIKQGAGAAIDLLIDQAINEILGG